VGGWSVDFAKLADLGFAGSEIAQAWPLARYCWLLAELPVRDEGLHGKRFNRAPSISPSQAMAPSPSVRHVRRIFLFSMGSSSKALCLSCHSTASPAGTSS
jgi:hypothetical protein